MNTALFRILVLLAMSLFSACSRWEPAICNNGLRCPLGCTADGETCIEALCRNARIDGNEECDDGNNTAGDGCSPDCKLEPRCGNGRIDPDEKCDDGNNTAGDGCRGDCQSFEGCGNGYLDEGEDCDDSNTLTGDGCHECRAELCGNNRLDYGEACDPPSEDPATYCSEHCGFNGSCGNSSKAPWEICDDGNAMSGDGCSSDCRSNESCGNGVIDGASGEQCDCGNNSASNMIAVDSCSGELNSPSGGYCRTDCRLHCGDGVIANDELCDDGSALPVFCAGLENGGNTYDLGLASCNACTPNYASCRYITVSSQPHPGLDKKLYGIWRAESGDIFAVGDNGIILHYSSSWVFEGSLGPTDANLFDVGGGGPDSIFAVGASGTILQRTATTDGFGWSDVLLPPLPPLRPSNPDLHGVWGGPSGDIFAVGASGTILHRPAGETSWHVDSAPTAEALHDIWGNEHGIFAVGTSGTILRRAPVTESPSEAQWVNEIFHPEDDYHALWGDEATIYAVGTSGRIIHFNPDDNRWVDEVSPTDKSLTGIFGSSPNDLFAVGQDGTIIHHSNNIWSPVRSTMNRNLRDVSVTAGEVIAIGDHGTIFSFTY